MRDPSKGGMAIGPVLSALLLVLGALVAAGCGGSSDDDASSSPVDNSLTAVGYSTLGPVYEEGLEPGFEATPKGLGAVFSANLFNASGTQSRAVAAGQPASIVHFSETGDMNRLVKAGLVSEDWDKQPYGGIAQDSVVAIMVRKGNPRGIHSFDDLLDKHVHLMSPNPFTSGFGRWSVMAVYGTELHEGKSEAEALDAVRALLEANVSIQPSSDYSVVEAFLQGESEAVLCYESEAIKAEAEGADVEYVVPSSTILIETPIAVTEEAPPAAAAFLEYVWSDAGQKIFAKDGYRPVDPKLVDPKRFPTPKDLFTIHDFGGWGKVNHELFDGRTGKVAKIEKELGVSTSG